MSESPHPNNFYSNKVGKHVVTADNLDNTVNHLNDTIDKTTTNRTDIDRIDTEVRTPTKGGTGIDTYTEGDILFSDAENSLAKLPKATDTSSADDPDNSDKKFLKSGDNPSWKEVEKNEVIGLKDDDSVEFDKIENTEWEGNKIKLKYGGTNYIPNLNTETLYKTHQGAIVIINDQETYDTNAPGENARFTSLKLKKGQFLVGSVTDIDDEGRPNVVLMSGDATMDGNGVVTVLSSDILQEQIDDNGNTWNSATDRNSGRMLTTFYDFIQSHDNRFIRYRNYDSYPLDENGDINEPYYDIVYRYIKVINDANHGSFTIKFSINLPSKVGNRFLTIENLIFHCVGRNLDDSDFSDLIVKIYGITPQGGSNIYNSYNILDTKNITIDDEANVGGFNNPDYHLRRHNINYIDSSNPSGLKLNGNYYGFMIEMEYNYSLSIETDETEAWFRITPPNIIYNYST